MAGSIRIIGIVKDRNPITGDEEEAYTVEVEVESEDSSKLAIEVGKHPYGSQIEGLMQRCGFLPNDEDRAKKEDSEIEKHDNELIKSTREGILEEINTFLTEKNKPVIAKAIKDHFEQKEQNKDTEEETDNMGES
jgi:hypothetical protein